MGLLANIRGRLARSLMTPDERAFLPFGPNGGAGSFEGAGYGRRLQNFQPSRVHINAALMAAGRTLVKRARFLVENNGYAGNAVEVWTSWVVGDGLRPRFANDAKTRQKFRKWAKEADADGLTNYYGIQDRVAREEYIAGECFVRRRWRRAGDMRSGVPFQLQVLPTEMLDLSYNVVLDSGHVVRMGIEFDKIGRRVAYHFWRVHPDDFNLVIPTQTRTRVDARDVIHVVAARQGGQIRGVSKFARAVVKLFMLDAYDDAELDRKRTAALFTAFITKVGDESPINNSDPKAEPDAPVQMEPGASVELLAGEDVKIAQPAESGASYEPFQYRTLLQVSAALNIPYAYLTGDTTKGNFSNVRTEVISFRRRVSQHQKLVLIPQLCDGVQRWFDEATSQPDREDDVDYLAPRMDWVDPIKDVKADLIAVRAGFKTMSQVIGENGDDIDETFDQIKRENQEADEKGLILDSDPRRTSAAGMSNAMPPGSGFPDPDDEVLDPSDNNDNSVIDPKGQAVEK